ncbi:hypothetical protein [Neorhizobium alkalisoli]|jgi:hypothetical protein|uniref:Uncharacterized protein n=1 Tax=Neorhizobium alkalisoli TaxID=528178 RepID=A0A561QSQ5_9HYPH|nr:hypothetical protein [Neorhizobium alkalisoli]TWF53440.1 hypothetical protein FHW37_104720 [Neorhizobium alkalisoli]
MQEMQKTIRDLTVEERQEILVDIAYALEGTSRDALVEGDQQFATLTGNMAEAILINADELAAEHPDEAERVVEQANSMISQFKTAHPYRMVSLAIH